MKAAIRSRLFFLLKLVFSAALIWLLIATRDIDAIAANIRKASLPLLLSSLGILFFSHFLGVAQWRVFLKGAHIPLPFFRASVYYFTGLFFNNFLFSSAGGDAVRVLDVTRGEKQKTGKVLACIFVDRIFGLLSLVLIGNAVFLIHLLAGGTAGKTLVLAYLMIDGGVLFGVACFLSRRIRYFLYYLAGKMPGHRFRLGLFHFLQIISGYRAGWRVFLRALPWGVANQAVKMGAFLLIGYALGFGNSEVNPLYCVIFIPLLGIVKIIPLSIMGFGPHEFAGEFLYRSVGIPALWSLPFLFLNQVIVMAANLLGGVFFLFRRGRGRK